MILISVRIPGLTLRLFLYLEVQFMTQYRTLPSNYFVFFTGHRKTAQGIIKEHFGHVTPNRV